MLFGIVVVVVALFVTSALVPVCIVGGVLVGALFVHTKPVVGCCDSQRWVAQISQHYMAEGAAARSAAEGRALRRL